MTVLVPAVPALTACRHYLLDRLAAYGNPLPVGVKPPNGDPVSYALLSRPGVNRDTPYMGHYLIRVLVFDEDVTRLERNADLVHGLMLAPRRLKIVVPDEGTVWITSATHSSGPSDHDDPDVPLFGRESAVYWTIGLKKRSP